MWASSTSNSFMLQEVVCCAPHWTVNWLWNSVLVVTSILLFAIWLCGVPASTEGLLAESGTANHASPTDSTAAGAHCPSSNQPYAATSSAATA